MAFSLRCTRCGGQEAEHEYQSEYGTCEAYVSPDPEAEAAMWRSERENEAERNERRRHRGPAYEH